MARQRSTDRLSTLPPELLSIIFDFVREDTEGEKMRGVICRALLHFTTKNLYQEVCLESLSSFQGFVRLTTVQPQEDSRRDADGHAHYLASLVQDLTVDFSDDTDTENDTVKDDFWDGFDWVALLKSLPNLARVDFSFCPQLTNALLSEAVSQGSLLKLKEINLTGPAPEYNLFDIRRFANLRHFRQLEELDLTYQGFRSGKNCAETPFFMPLMETDYDVSAGLLITSLYIRANLNSSSSEQIASFLECFPNLTLLHIEDDWGSLDLDEVLEGVSTDLIELFIGLKYEEGVEPVSDGLKRLSKLRTLNLDYGAYNYETLEALQDCNSLEVLWLGGYDDEDDEYDEHWPQFADVSYNRLYFFLQYRPSSLRELELDFFHSGSTGEDLQHFGHIPEPDSETMWRLPKWPRNFSYKKAVAFVTHARDLGIIISGSIIDAIEVQEEWDEEITKLKCSLAKKAEQEKRRLEKERKKKRKMKEEEEDEEKLRREARRELANLKDLNWT